MIGEGVVIGYGCKIGKGVLFGNGVRFGKGVVVLDFLRIGRQFYRGDDWDFDEERDEFEKEEIFLFFGEDFIGYFWFNEEEEFFLDFEDEGEDFYEYF